MRFFLLILICVLISQSSMARALYVSGNSSDDKKGAESKGNSLYLSPNREKDYKPTLIFYDTTPIQKPKFAKKKATSSKRKDVDFDERRAALKERIRINSQDRKARLAKLRAKRDAARKARTRKRDQKETTESAQEYKPAARQEYKNPNATRSPARLFGG